MRDQFLVEVAHATIEDVARLNQAFAAWVELDGDHRAVHSKTAMTPLERFNAATQLRYPTPSNCTRRSCGPSLAP